MGDMPRLGLEEEEKITVLLSFVVIGKEPLLGIQDFVEVARNFVLLDSELEVAK